MYFEPRETFMMKLSFEPSVANSSFIKRNAH